MSKSKNPKGKISHGGEKTTDDRRKHWKKG